MEFVFSSGTVWVLILSSLICLTAPIVLVFRYKKQYDANISSFFLGMAGYFLFGMIIYQFLFALMLSFLPSITKIPWQSAFYTALLSAFTGGIGRYIMLKYALRNRMSMGDALMYGAGHGGLYAMAYGTSLCITNAISILLNNHFGTVSSLEKLGFEGKSLDKAVQGIKQLHEISTYQHLFDGFTPFIILFVEVSLAVFTFVFIQNNLKALFPLSIVLHFIVLLSYGFEKKGILLSPLFALLIIIAIAMITYHYAKKLRTALSDDRNTL